MDDLPDSPTTTLRVSAETRAAVNALCSQSTATQDAVVSAAVSVLQTRGLAGNGLIRLELVRAIDNLETTAELLAVSNLRLADCCSALLEGRLANIDQVLADVTAAKEVRHG